jgi:hypothetical protein
MLDASWRLQICNIPPAVDHAQCRRFSIANFGNSGDFGNFLGLRPPPPVLTLFDPRAPNMTLESADGSQIVGYLFVLSVRAVALVRSLLAEGRKKASRLVLNADCRLLNAYVKDLVFPLTP